MRAPYLNSYTATPLLCFAKHGRQQGGLSAAHMSDHSNEGTLWYVDVDPASKERHCPLSLTFVWIVDLVIILISLPFKTWRALCRPAESAVLYHHVVPI